MNWFNNFLVRAIIVCQCFNLISCVNNINLLVSNGIAPDDRDGEFYNVCDGSGNPTACSGGMAHVVNNINYFYCCADSSPLLSVGHNYYCNGATTTTCEEVGLQPIPNHLYPTQAPVVPTPTAQPNSFIFPPIPPIPPIPTPAAPKYQTCCADDTIGRAGVSSACNGKLTNFQFYELSLRSYCCNDGNMPTFSNGDCFCNTATTCPLVSDGVSTGAGCRGLGCNFQNSRVTYTAFGSHGTLCCPNSNDAPKSTITAGYLKVSCPASSATCPFNSEPVTEDYLGTGSSSSFTSTSSVSPIDGGIIAGIVVAVLFLFGICIAIAVFYGNKKKASPADHTAVDATVVTAVDATVVTVPQSTSGEDA